MSRLFSVLAIHVLLLAACLSLAACGAKAPVSDQTVPLMSLSPDAALERLRAGNARYVSGETTWDGATPEEIAFHVAGQNPYAIILSCADSRVPVEKVFDAGLGEIFILRVAGNVWTNELIGSAEYSVAALDTPLIVVMGHSFCGAIKGALDVKNNGTEYPDYLQELLIDIGEGFDASDSTEAAVRRNVERQVAATSSVPLFADAIAEGRLRVVGAVYDLDSGRVEFLP